MKKILLILSAAAFALNAQAEGYQVNNFSARQTGMANVGAAMKLGSESIYFNPAATAFQTSKFDISVGGTGIFSFATATDMHTGDNYQSSLSEDSDNKMSTPIHAYINWKPADRWAVGLGFYTPNGSGMNWGDDWSGAHLIQNIKLAAYCVQPTVSFKIRENLSIGAGLMISWGSFNLSRSLLPAYKRQALVAALDPSIQQLQGAIASGALAGDALTQAQNTLQMLQGASGYLNSTMDKTIAGVKLEGTSNVAVGVNLGIFWDVTDQWSLAATWRSRMNLSVDAGTSSVALDPTAAQLIQGLGQLAAANPTNPVLSGVASQLGGISALDGATFGAELPLPATVTVGASFRPNERWEMGVDLQWIGWSAYDKLDVAFNNGLTQSSVKNYSNTVTVRFGTQYKGLDWMTPRIGVYFDESPVDSNYLNPETPSMSKVTYTAGASFNLAKCMALDVAYGYVTTADPERTGSYPVFGTDGKLESVFTRNYKLSAHIASVGLRFNF